MGAKQPTYVIDPADGLKAMTVQPWAERKHYYVRRYMDIFANGMKRWPNLTYVDLFAGPGRCYINKGKLFVPGSPQISLSYPFKKYVFVEKNASAVEALKKRMLTLGGSANIAVIRGDCNTVIDQVRREVPTRGLTLAFIDPTNWQIRFSTVAALVADRPVDLIVTFMAGMMKRVPVSAVGTALDEFFGTDRWRRLTSRTLFAFVQLYREQLATLGYVSQAPKVEIVVSNSKRAPMYQIAFFSKNAKGYEFWDKISLVDERGQPTLFS